MKKKNNKDVTFVTKELKKSTVMNDDTKRVISFLLILVIVCGLFTGLYMLQNKVSDKLNGEETTTAVTYDASSIIIPDMFKKTKEEFLVLCYDSSDNIANIKFSSLVASYKGNLYVADLSDGMNAKYYNKDGKENKNPTKAEDVVITKTTLIGVKDGKVISYTSNEDEIAKKLQ